MLVRQMPCPVHSVVAPGGTALPAPSTQHHGVVCGNLSGGRPNLMVYVTTYGLGNGTEKGKKLEEGLIIKVT